MYCKCEALLSMKKTGNEAWRPQWCRKYSIPQILCMYTHYPILTGSNVYSYDLGHVHISYTSLVGAPRHIPLWTITFHRAVASLVQYKLEHNLKLTQ